MAGTLLRTIQLLDSACRDLELNINLSDVERIGVMVNKAMSTQARSFHTAEHIFNLIRPGYPLQTLAAIFHDIVYFTIDEGFIPEIETILEEYIYIEDNKVFIKETLPENYRLLRGALTLFGFEPGSELPGFGGMNEFLSTLVFIHEFEPHIDFIRGLEVICYIEETIPFRAPNAQGKTPAEVLAGRMQAISGEYNLDLKDELITPLIQAAVKFANTDVENFSEKDVAAFLDNTWKLLPETNPALRTNGLYTVRNYRIALQKMEGFMGFLDPNLIFSAYKGYPEQAELDQLTQRAERNIMAARDYLGTKLLTTGILEAIAYVSGGDVPIALLMGDIDDPSSVEKFEKMLPHQAVQSGASISATVYNLLAKGRNDNTKFDLNRSPLASYIYLHTGTSNMKKFLEPLKKFFNEEQSAEQFLDSLPLNLISPVIKACGEMAYTRKSELKEFLLARDPSAYKD